MGRAFVRALVGALTVLWALPSIAADLQSPAGLARRLMTGCLEPPNEATLSQLASAAGAKSYPDLRRRRELGDLEPVIYPEPGSKQSQRTRVTVIAFQGWDLAGPGAGTLEFRAEKTQIDWIEQTSRQPLTPVRTTLGRSCTLHAPVAKARAIFELFESMTDRIYGIRVSADRSWIDVFMFDEDQYDIELSLKLEKPLAGLIPDSQDREGRLVLPDGGSRISNYGVDAIPTVALSRKEFLEGLDQPATMNLLNEAIQPVLQRLATAP